MKTCSENGCKLAAKTRGMCRKHYHYAWTHGLVAVREHAARKGEGEVWLRSQLGAGGDACILWPFGIDSAGYGQASLDGEKIAAHRAMCILAHGPPPFDGAQAAHYRCGNRRCINEDHLRWSDIETNHDDKRRHGTMTRGERHPRSAFTEAEVLQIANDNRSAAEIAREHGVTTQAIYGIRSGKTWSWLTGIRKAA